MIVINAIADLWALFNNLVFVASVLGFVGLIGQAIFKGSK